MNLRRVAVLGSNSFSGADFIDLLLERGEFDVLGVSRSSEKGPLFLNYLRHGRDRFRFVQIDLNRDLDRLQQVLDEFRPSWIVNFAAQSEVAPSWEHPEHWFQTNCVALSVLINHLRTQDYIERYLHISSPEVYGTCVGTVKEDAPLNPSTPYAASKAAADLLLSTLHRQFGFPILTVRSTNVYGARQQLFKIIPRSVIYLKLGQTVELHGGGRAVKSYTHIRDVSRGEKLILENGQVGQIYHLSPDQGVEVREVVRLICRRLNRPFDEATRSVAERPGQDAAYVIDSTRARAELGWHPQLSLADGLEEVIQWVTENLDEIRCLPHTYEHKP